MSSGSAGAVGVAAVTGTATFFTVAFFAPTFFFADAGLSAVNSASTFGSSANSRPPAPAIRATAVRMRFVDVAHQGGVERLADAVCLLHLVGGAGLLHGVSYGLDARVAGAERGVLIGGRDLGLVARLPGAGDGGAEEVEIVVESGDGGGRESEAERCGVEETEVHGLAAEVGDVGELLVGVRVGVERCRSHGEPPEWGGAGEHWW